MGFLPTQSAQMKVRHWIIASVVAGLAMWGGVFFAVKSMWPKLPELAEPIESSNPVGLLLEQARAAEREKNYQRAIELYSGGIDDDKTPSLIRRQLLRARAFAYEGAEQHEQAEADYNAMLKIEPLDPDYYAKRGFYFMRCKRYDDALADFAQGARLDPKDGGYAYGAGLVHDERGEYARAIESFNQAIHINPKITTYYTARGSAHNHTAKYTEAYADYDKALQIGFPIPIPEETARAHMGRGFASLHLGNYRHAIDDFDLVLKVVPRASNALAWRGSAYQGLGKKELAIADYKAALAINPGNTRAAKELNGLEGATNGLSR
jgi:tetratricopeptide (TPR) repeat protein